ncbi:hypothetical protein OAR89_02375 [Pelagibacteraceae bacterium]|jgi:uncharacterized protein|nr:hypothetical protein [Pelagibacteraceae bacterium]
MITFFEIIIILVLITIQSIFGVGLLLFGTPSFLLLGYDFANTINILMPVSITISALQFFKSKVSDRNFINQYNLFCLPFLILFLVLALKFKHFLDFKIIVAFLLIFSSILILNKRRFSSFKKIFFNSKKYILIGIGCVHGMTNMGGSFLAIYSTLISKNVKEVARYYISYGYLIMGVLQFLTVLFISFKILHFNKLYYIFLAAIIYFPTQKIFKNINDKKFSKYINLIALTYGVLILIFNY